MSNDGLNKKQVFLSSGMAIISFLITVFIGFWTSPFIVSKLGAEAYGFSTLGGNFTTYMSLVTVAINSFAARYITIEIQKNNIEQASKYFTSVFYTNIIIALIMLLPITIVVISIDSLFVIPDNLVTAVRAQWILLFAAWILELVFKVYSTTTMAKDRLDINQGLTAVSNIIRLGVIVVLFSFFSPKLWYIGIAAFICAMFVNVGHMISKRKLMTEVELNWKYFDFRCICTLFIKGIWNSLNQLSSILINGLGLLITNIFISPTSMGYYSIAQMVPNYMQSLMYTLCDMFHPNLIASYAKGKNEEVRDGLKFAMKFSGLLLMVPLMGFFVYGRDFYALWQYSLDGETIEIINVLSILVILPMVSSLFVQPLLTVNTITARLKLPVVVNLLIGVLNVGIQVILIKTTNLGVFAVAGVSSVLILLRNYLFYPIYAAKNLNLPIYTFYPDIIRGTGVTALVFAFLYVTHRCISINSWIELVVFAIIFGLLAELIAFALLPSKAERKMVIEKITKRINKSR